jgi:hypothetical protein
MATQVATGTDMVSGGVGAAVVRTALTGEIGDSKESSAMVDAMMVVLGKGGGSTEGTGIKTGKSTGAAGTFEKTCGNGAVACTFGTGTSTVAGKAAEVMRADLGLGRWVVGGWRLWFWFWVGKNEYGAIF